MDARSASVRDGASVAVLHVDDSTANRYRRRRALQAGGFRVSDVDTGAAARVHFTRERPDLVLIDVRLSDTDGFQLAEAIKGEVAAAQRDVGVVLISAHFTESEFRVRGLESGADAYLIEPITDAELVATLRAVSRRVEQLKAARENARLLDAVFDCVPEGITVADAPDVKIRRVSRFGTSILGRSRAELEGIPAAEHPERWSVFRSDGSLARPEDLPLTRAVTKGGVITDEEWIMRRADGQQIVVLCNAAPIHDGEGHIAGGIIAWRDITTRREVEDELRRRTEELRSVDKAKNDFLATVVHEIRQPLQAALTALAVMRRRPNRPAGERARDVAERQLLRIGRIVEDLLDATRIIRGEVPLKLERHDLGDMLRLALETMRAEFSDRQLQLALQIPTASVVVTADGARLQQVFVNLLANAAHYTPSGGSVEIVVETSDDSAIVHVKDTGDGIASDRLAHIFDLFVRVSQRDGGFGIGLAVVRALVEAHGGTVQAFSDGPGKGAEFVVTLPLS